MVVRPEEYVYPCVGYDLRIIIGSRKGGISCVGFSGQREFHVGDGEVRPFEPSFKIAEEHLPVLVQLFGMHHHIPYEDDFHGVP